MPIAVYRYRQEKRRNHFDCLDASGNHVGSITQDGIKIEWEGKGEPSRRKLWDLILNFHSQSAG